MDLNLQPQAATCFVSGEPFAEGDRVVSHLVRAENLEIRRHDVHAERVAEFQPAGVVVCHWRHDFKPRSQQENPDRVLKLTAENLFLTLADPVNEPSEENGRLVQFLALMLERKKLLRPRGRTADGARLVYEHARTKQLFEVPAGEMDPGFFIAIQEQLSVLVGAPAAAQPEPATAAEPAAN